MTELQRELADFVKGQMPTTLILAQVTYVIDDGPWCNCEDADGNEYYEVRLQPQLLNGSQTYVIPKVGSWVTIGSIRGREEYCVLQIGEIDYLIIVAGQSSFMIKDEGFVIKRNSETLAGLVEELIAANEDLIAAIKLITVTCAAPGAPSSVPINIASFATVESTMAALKTRFNQILKTS